MSIMLEALGVFIFSFVLMSFAPEPKEVLPNIYENEKILIGKGQRVTINPDTGEVTQTPASGIPLSKIVNGTRIYESELSMED